MRYVCRILLFDVNNPKYTQYSLQYHLYVWYKHCNYQIQALQQQFNKYIFKLEQDEYEREGILWKFISFPDNQEILDLIDKKHTGIFATLDEQCIVPSSDQKFTRFLYSKCEKHPRFGASAGQKVNHKFTIEHYAGPVEYSTESWLEKNKDQMPSASVDLLKGAKFELLGEIQVRTLCPENYIIIAEFSTAYLTFFLSTNEAIHPC